MTHNNAPTTPVAGIGFFERYLTLWVLLCIVAGIALGRLAPDFATSLDRMSVTVDGAPVISIPIAICLFFMMYPIMAKIDFAEVLQAGKSLRPVLLTLVVNWAIKPFTMYAIASFFLGTLFLPFIGPAVVDHVTMPLGVNLPVGEAYGAGTVVLHQGVKMLEVPLWRSYLAGCILLGIAPCTAMVPHDPVDRDPALHPDRADLLRHLWAIQTSRLYLRKCLAISHDRGVESL